MIKALWGAGGSSHDIMAMHGDMPRFVDEKYYKDNAENILPASEFNPLLYEILVTVAEPFARKRIVESLPKETRYWSYVHPSAQLLGKEIVISEGTLISANCIVVCHTRMGKHTQLNFGTIIGHDSNMGDYFTTAPGAGIMGDCKIGNRVYFGANSCCKQKVSICNDVVIGLGAAVVKDIREPGTYVGIPAKKVKK
jgi:sugar O-acyltransferase (sialic acid O-acetyltransferase NeuD family)